jgi:acyl dehydratase
MAMIFETPAALLERVGEHLGHSEWISVEQSRIDQFAEATGDHQWIHVDPARAASGPFGACIAHGYLTLALVNLFLPQIVEVRGISMGVNYGCERVRFPNVVRAGSNAQLVAAEEVKGGVQATIRVSVEIEGEERPGCVVDTISRYYPAG